MAEKTIKVLLVGEDKSAGKTLRDVGDEAEKAGGRLSRMGEIAGGVLTADLLRAAGDAVVDFGKASVTSFMEADKAQRQLEDAYERFPNVADVSIESLRELNQAIQDKTGADADDIASSQAVMAQYGLTGAQLAELTPLLDDYAVKTGKDLTAAAEDLGKAMLGQGRALKDVGIDFQDTGSVAGNFEQVMGGLRTQVGGFAESEAGTAEGKLRALQTSFGDVQEAVGEQLLPVLIELGDNLLGLIGFVQENSDVLIPLAAVIGTVIGLATAWNVIQGILNITLAANPIGLVVLAIAALVAGFITAYNTSETFRNIVDGALQWVRSSAQGVADWFSGPFVSFFTDAGQRIGDFFMVDVPGFFGRAAEAIGAAFSGVKDLLLAPIRSAVQWINDTFVSGINGFLGTIGISWRVPTIPGFADGGYTGAGGKYQPAGIVHAGEVVWSQDDVAAWGGPQAVDSMRRARSAALGFTGDAYQLGPGYAGGGIVGNFSGYDPGALAAMKAWAGATGRTWTQTGKGGARTYAEQWQLYLNHLAGGNLAADPRKGLGPHMVPAIAMDLSPRPGENAAAKALLPGFGLGLTVPGEPWHIAKLGGRGGGVTAGGAVDFGIGAIIDGLLSKLPGLTEPWGDVLKTIVGKVPEALIDKVMGLFGFDDGGYMMPGMVGINRTGSPEPVFTSEQWDILRANVGGVSVASLREALDGLGVRITGASVLGDQLMGQLDLAVARRI